MFKTISSNPFFRCHKAIIGLTALRNRRWFLVSAAGMMIGCGNPLDQKKAIPPTVSLDQTPTQAGPAYQGPSPQELLTTRLKECEANCQEAIAEAVKPLSHLFSEARLNTHGFAGAALSLRSTYYSLVDRIPYLTNQNWLETHLTNKFKEYFFSADDLESALQSGVEAFVAVLDAEENRMLVRLRADLEGLPEGVRPSLDLSQIPGMYQAALASAHEASLTKGTEVLVDRVMVMVSTEVLIRILSRLLRTTIRRLLTSLGLRGLFTAGGGLTGGPVGLVGGAVLDFLIGSIWEWWTNPQGNLAAKLEADLDAMERALVEGDEENDGIRGVLGKVLKARAEQRAQLLQKWISDNR